MAIKKVTIHQNQYGKYGFSLTDNLPYEYKYRTHEQALKAGQFILKGLKRL